MAPEAVYVVFALGFGLLTGSFANVCIHRLPLGESVVTPRSRCPGCRTPIAARDNVPVLSWLLLRARCRTCGAPISARYPAIELLVGALFAATVALHGPGLPAVAGCVLSGAAVVLSMTDLEHRILPDEITLGALVLGVGLALARDVAAPPPRWTASVLAESAAGAAFGAAILLAVRWAYQRLQGIEGMGEGDVTTIAMAGAFVGPAGVLLLLFLASAAGALVGGGTGLVRRLRWTLARRRVRADAASAGREAASAGLLVAPDGSVAQASERWLEIPGAAPPGQPVGSSGPVARPVAAFVRLARRRARAGLPTEVGRVPVEETEGTFFRMLALRAEPTPAGLLVLVGRADIPFGVFLAASSVAVHAVGRRLLGLLFGGDAPLGPLLP